MTDAPCVQKGLCHGGRIIPKRKEEGNPGKYAAFQGNQRNGAGTEPGEQMGKMGIGNLLFIITEDYR